MSFTVTLPQIGFSMNEGMLTEWLVKDGDTVKTGDPLYSLESEKSVQEVESPASGVVRILVEPGIVYPVGHILAEIT